VPVSLKKLLASALTQQHGTGKCMFSPTCSLDKCFLCATSKCDNDPWPTREFHSAGGSKKHNKINKFYGTETGKPGKTMGRTGGDRRSHWIGGL
jgi:hypothetical protein